MTTKATLYTDASLRTQDGAGGWAMWAAGPPGRLVHGGILPVHLCANSTYGEMGAITAGLHAIHANWPEVNEVLVRSDNQAVMLTLEGGPRATRLQEKHAVMKGLVDEIGRLGLKLTGAWVKGHQSADTRPAYVNRAVDRIARANMREAVEVVRRGEIIDPYVWIEHAKAAPRVAPAETRISDLDGTEWYCFPAKFDSYCAACGGAIPLGQPVIWRKGARAFEPACWEVRHIVIQPERLPGVR